MGLNISISLGDIISIASVIFTAGGLLSVITYRIKVLEKKIDKLEFKNTALKAYFEGKLTELALKLEEKIDNHEIRITKLEDVETIYEKAQRENFKNK